MKNIKISFNDTWNIVFGDVILIDPRSIDFNNKLWERFKEDIFQLKSKERGQLIDLGWYPEFDPNGKFKLMLIGLIDDEESQIEQWLKPIDLIVTDSIELIQNKIKEWSYGESGI